MSTTIYYFTSTGNSLLIARKLAKELGDTKLVSIPQFINEKRTPANSENIGIVIPVYAWGLPRIVSEFINKLIFSKNQYIFAIATCGGVAGKTLEQIDRVLLNKGMRISAGFVVKEASYPINDDKDILPIKIAKMLGGKERTQLASFDSRRREIISTIKNREKHSLESTNIMADLYGNFLHKNVIPSFKKQDNNFWVNENCNGCKTCIKICPRNNISYQNGEINWNHDCEACQACLVWCPNEAINFGKNTKYRSHNAEINLKDLLGSNN